MTSGPRERWRVWFIDPDPKPPCGSGPLTGSMSRVEAEKYLANVRTRFPHNTYELRSDGP